MISFFPSNFYQIAFFLNFESITTFPIEVLGGFVFVGFFFN